MLPPEGKGKDQHVTELSRLCNERAHLACLELSVTSPEFDRFSWRCNTNLSHLRD